MTTSSKATSLSPSKGIQTGFPDLDRLTHGFHKEDLIVIGGESGIGKSALALGFLEAAVLPRRTEATRTLFISLEMSKEQVATRLIFSRARVKRQAVLDGLVSKSGDEFKRLADVEAEFASAPCIIDDTPCVNVLDLPGLVTNQSEAGAPFGLIIVDGIQSIGPVGNPNVTEEQRISDAARTLKYIARVMKVPVVATSSVNRALLKENRPPRMRDLRGSGAIEDVADVVLLLGRPRDDDERFAVAAANRDLFVPKQRNGPIGELRLIFLTDIVRFEPYQ